MSIISDLNDKFKSRYSKKVVDLNKNVYPAVKNDKGYEAPVIFVGPGGGTLITGTGVEALNPMALVDIKFRTLKPTTLVYRIGIPFYECEIAANNPAYFNYLFDTILERALGNYRVTVGDEDKVRFGEYYCKMQLIPADRDDYIILELKGSWASEEEVL